MKRMDMSHLWRTNVINNSFTNDKSSLTERREDKVATAKRGWRGERGSKRKDGDQVSASMPTASGYLVRSHPA